MDKRSIVLFLNRRGLTAQVIHKHLAATLGEESIAYSTVTNYLLAARIIPGDVTSFSTATSPHIDESDDVIVRALDELTFSSVRQPSCVIHLPETTVYRRVSEKLGCTAHYLWWVRHILSDDQNATRVQSSKSILTILRAEKTRDWQYMVTLDESWFYYVTDHELI
jgi:hypothetical protein